MILFGLHEPLNFYSCTCTWLACSFLHLQMLKTIILFISPLENFPQRLNLSSFNPNFPLSYWKPSNISSTFSGLNTETLKNLWAVSGTISNKSKRRSFREAWEKSLPLFLSNKWEHLRMTNQNNTNINNNK